MKYSTTRVYIIYITIYIFIATQQSQLALAYMFHVCVLGLDGWKAHSIIVYICDMQ